MWKFVKKAFAVITTFFNLEYVNSLECISMNNQDLYLNNNEPVFYPYNIKANKCSGSFNNINGPYAKLCVSDIIKNINVKAFNLISRINET